MSVYEFMTYSYYESLLTEDLDVDIHVLPSDSFLADDRVLNKTLCTSTREFLNPSVNRTMQDSPFNANPRRLSLICNWPHSPGNVLFIRKRLPGQLFLCEVNAYGS